MADTEQHQRQAHNDSHGDGHRQHHQRPDRDEPVMVKRGESGVVKWFSFKSGYGFIAIDNSDEEVFVHSSSIVTLRKVFCVLHDGDQVEFDVIQGMKGLEAIAVTGLGGKKIGGARFNDRRPPIQQGGEKNGSGGGGAGKGRRRRTTSQEHNNNDDEGGKQQPQGEENGGDGAEGGGRKQNGGRGPRRGPRGGGKRTGGEKYVDAKESPEGGDN